MSDLKRFSRLGQVDFLNASNPTSSVVGARVGHQWCNYTTGTIWTCVDDTFGSQRWEGDNGIVAVSITAPDHPDRLSLWTMDNISGSTLVDDSPNGADATISGASQVTGLIGNALDFAPPDYVRIDPASLYGRDPTQFAITQWVNFDSSVLGGYIFSHRNSSNDLIQLNSNNGSNQMLLQVRSSGTSLQEAASAVGEYPTNGAWELVTTNFDKTGNRIEVFLGTTSVITITTAFSGTFYSTILTLGAYTTDGLTWLTHMDGQMDHTGVFSRPLTLGEIALIQAEGAPS